ncbi:MAG TPA: hypothetical protein ENK91_15410, partial [Bacteroidetes bacterium]|nr:hypothetical protein [Bacteroidota bacterium]
GNSIIAQNPDQDFTKQKKIKATAYPLWLIYDSNTVSKSVLSPLCHGTVNVDGDVCETDDITGSYEAVGSSNWRLVLFNPAGSQIDVKNLPWGDSNGNFSFNPQPIGNGYKIELQTDVDGYWDQRAEDWFDVIDCGFQFDCNDYKKVDMYGTGSGNCNNSPYHITVNIPNPGNVYQVKVEAVFKGENPGNSATAYDNNNTPHSLPLVIDNYSKVYRGTVIGSFSSFSINNVDNSCGDSQGLQSLVLYVYRNITTAVSQGGTTTNINAYCDIQTTTISIPPVTTLATKDILIKLPISELTDDGRYLTVEATSGGVTNSTTINGPDVNLDICCLDIVELTLSNVPASTNQVDLTIYTDGAHNPDGSGNCGQSYTIGGIVTAESVCEECTLTGAGKTNEQCNDNGTPANPNDDFISFYLNPTGTDLATGYDVSVSPNISINPTSALYGTSTYFELGGASANGTVYTITITDQDDQNCTIQTTVMKNECSECPDINLNVTGNNEHCDMSDGSATASASGGTSPYTYHWSNGSNGSSINNISAGTYYVTATD